MNNGCIPVPVFTVTSITFNAGNTTATLKVSQPLPKSGCFNLRFAGGRCCLRISPCAKEQIIVTDGTTTYSNVYGRCGNLLQLGQIARHMRRWNCLHFRVTTNPAGNLMSLDKLCPPLIVPDVLSGVSVVTAATPSAS